MDKKILKYEEAEHRKFHTKLVYVFIVILIVLFGGATIYHYVEKWRFLDALYFSAATMTTVGYGDLAPKTDAGKIFTIGYVFFGVGIALYGLSLLASHFVEVREEFWLENIGKIRIKHHTETFWGKVKNFLGFKKEELVKEYGRSNGSKK